MNLRICPNCKKMMTTKEVINVQRDDGLGTDMLYMTHKTCKGTSVLTLKTKEKKMENVKGILMGLVFALSLGIIGCSGGGGGSSAAAGGSPHVPDNTPHDYTLKVVQLYAPAAAYALSLHQICADGFPGFRDETAVINLNAPGSNGAVGCNAAENVVHEIVNPYGVSFAVIVSIDGVDQPDEVLLPGQTFHFEAGF